MIEITMKSYLMIKQKFIRMNEKHNKRQRHIIRNDDIGTELEIGLVLKDIEKNN